MSKHILFLAAATLLAACNGGGSGDGSTDLVDVAPSAPTDPGNGGGGGSTPAGPQLSAFEDWGTINGEMPIDFSDLQFDQEKVRLFYQYQSGAIFNTVSPDAADLEIRRCKDHIKITGTETEGYVTISQSELVWAQDVHEYPNDTHCLPHDGVYHYLVTEDGLYFGIEGSEVLYQ